MSFAVTHSVSSLDFLASRGYTRLWPGHSAGRTATVMYKLELRTGYAALSIRPASRKALSEATLLLLYAQELSLTRASQMLRWRRTALRS
jgi:hypothetical protein